MSESQMQPGAFDLGGYMSALVVGALETPSGAAPVGWLAAFLAGKNDAVSLADVARHHAALADGIWKAGEDPRALLDALPIFGIMRPDGEYLTEPRELAGQNWRSAQDHMALFSGMAAHLPYLTARCDTYLRLLTTWQAAPAPPEAGYPRVCYQYAALFNERLYTECYKLLELRWMVEEGRARSLLKGMMQLAVGLQQIENGRYAVPQLEEAYFNMRENLEAFPTDTLRRFLKRLKRTIGLLKSYGPSRFQTFDMELFPRLWMDSPWRLLFMRSRRR